MAPIHQPPASPEPSAALDACTPFPSPAPQPVSPRPASTTLVLRDNPAGHLEVLMLRRQAGAKFMPGHYVFPGGTVDAADAADAAWAHADEAAAVAEARLCLPEGGRGYALAALRECAEECGLWLGAPAGQGGGAQAQTGAPRWHVSALHPWAHWVSPRGLPQRFDTRFFVVAAPPDQQAVCDDREIDALEWIRPELALSEGRLLLAFVTQRMLASLAPYANVAAVLAQAQQRHTLEVVHPRLSRNAAGEREVIHPGHPAYAEVARLDPNGSGQARSGIVAGAPVRIGQAVWRVTAPNPGRMSGPGTNTYLLGRGGQWLVLDPGPADEAHLSRLMALTQGCIQAVVVTHTHLDHSPGATPLAALTGAPLVGLLPPPGPRQDGGFAPQVQPTDGQVIDLAGVQLQAIHTPGHASNHVCWWLAEEALLFTGDHLMQGSTVVIDPPDGDMAVYMQSLRGLPERLPGMAWLAPGHGFMMAHPQRAIAHLLRHRQAREDKLVAALQRLGAATLPALLDAVYDDVASVLRPAAERSLLAHLLKLRGEGRAAEQARGWGVVRG